MLVTGPVHPLLLPRVHGSMPVAGDAWGTAQPDMRVLSGDKCECHVRWQVWHHDVPSAILTPTVSGTGADRLLAMDLHSGQCVGYFDIPVDHVYGESVILDYLASKRISTGAAP